MADIGYNPAKKDDSGLTATERFSQIADFYLAAIRASGSSHPPDKLYDRLIWSPSGYYSEKDRVERWAGKLDVPIRFILQGITRGFAHAKKSGTFVRSFVYVECWICQRVNEGTPL